MSDNKRKRKLLVGGLVTIVFSVLALFNSFVAAPYEVWNALLAVGIALLIFLWAYFAEHEAWAAIGAYVMGAIDVLVIMTTWVKLADQWVPALVLTLVALPFFVGWWLNRKQWGLLIPAYIMLAIIPITLFGDNLGEYLVPAYVMGAVGLPFLVAAVVRVRWVIALPGLVLLFIGAVFVGVQLGLATIWLTLGLPIVALAIGVGLLLWVWLEQAEEIRQ